MFLEYSVSSDAGLMQNDEPCAKRRLLAELKASRSVANEPTAALETEMRNYASHVPTDEEEQNSLLFWKAHGDKYPHLSNLAKEHLSIPATSVPVESMFSTAGLILNSRRSSLSPANMNMVLFIHDNINVV